QAPDARHEGNMGETRLALKLPMTDCAAGCPERIQHFLKFRALARAAAGTDGLEPEAEFVLEAAAPVRGTVIKPGLEPLGASAGRVRWKLGAPWPSSSA
ncbi:MAG: hypothetical protein LBQ12_07300, partial [Deltaproteobacteria bacterium]|nr:hypothetical protein [Deltaproteobacteria bacterium]